MTQKEQIRAHLDRGKPLDAMAALRLYGCFRLAARILELKEAGVRVKRQMRVSANGARYAVYSL